MKKLTFILVFGMSIGVSTAQFNPIQYEFGYNLDPTTSSDIGIDLERLNDGNFVFTATKSIGTFTNNIEIRKIDPRGNTIWDVTYGGSNDERVGEVQPTSDGGFVVSGSTVSFGGSGQNMMLLKYNSNGVLQWQRFYSSLGLASTVKPINGGVNGFRIAGSNKIITTDASGNQISILNISTEEQIHSLTNTSDGGFAVAISSPSRVLKYNSSGTILWSQALIPTVHSSQFHTTPREIQETPNGDLVICGYTIPVGEGYQGFFFRLQSNGAVLANHTYTTFQWAPTCDVHGILLYDMVQIPDGSFIMGGTADVGNPTQVGTTTCYVKVDSQGNLGDISLTSVPKTWIARGNLQADYYATVQGMCKANLCGDAIVAVGHEKPAGAASNNQRIIYQKFYDKDYNTPVGGFDHENYDYTHIDINTNTTWSGVANSKKVAGKIVVKSPNTLTISNEAIVEMGLCGKIVVEPGARLIVDNATITSLSAYDISMWTGIDVWGNRNISQHTPGAQGQVIVRNNAVIENAYTAITTIRNPNDIGGSGWDWNSTGGIINASDCMFKNNSRDIQFLSYQNTSPSNSNILLNNRSSFRNVTFETNDQLRKPGVLPTYHVTMFEVTGITYSGCIFQNTAATGANNGVLGGGINALDARFSVRSSCDVLTLFPNPCPPSSLNRSKFTNLLYGVRASNGGSSTRNVTIDETDFLDVKQGVYLRGADFSSITRSTFEIPDGTFSFPGGIVAAYGAYFDHSQSFKCEDNDFESDGTNNTFKFGVIVNNSLSGASTVYSNRFKGTTVGTHAQRDNYDGQLGLKINCDDYNFPGEENMYDIAVTGGTIDTEINPFQGTCTVNPETMVRNSYGALCAGNDNQYYVDKLSVNPILHGNSSDLNGLPNCSAPDVVLWDCGALFNPEFTCPSTLNKTKPILKSAIRFNQDIIDEEIVVLNEGASQLLLDAINSLSNGDLLELLLVASPYLSDEVLLAYLAKDGVPNGHIKDVILANSPVSEVVQNALGNLNLPKGINNQINAAQVGISVRTQQEALVSHHRFERGLAVADLIRYFLMDTTEVNGLDSVIVIIENENWTNVRCKLVDALIDRGDYTRAIEELDDMQSDPSMASFCEFKRLVIGLNQQIARCYTIRDDETKRNEVEGIANDTQNHDCKNAQSLLTFIFDMDFPEDIIPPMEGTGQKSMQASNDDSGFSAIQSNQDFVKLYPNPANENLFVEYDLEDSEANYSLIIHDMLGNQLTQQNLNGGKGLTKVDLGKIPQGIYICSIFMGDQLMENLKFVVTK